MKINKKGLKAALSRHIVADQLRTKQSKALKASVESQTLKQKSKANGNTKTKSKKSQVHLNQKGLIPFTPEDYVLLIGEGDFSFAVSIIKQNYVVGSHLIATSYDSLEDLKAKYPNATENLEYLTQHGVDIIHEIDTNDLIGSFKLDTKKAKAKRNSVLKVPKLDYIMFNFPHTGRGMKDVDRNIRDHQKLMVNYFKSCKRLIELVNDDSHNDFGGYITNQDANILVTLFEGEPYDSWQIKMLAKTENYKVQKSGKFDWQDFPEYQHRRTNSTRDTTKPANERSARIYVFEPFKKVQEEEESTNKT